MKKLLALLLTLAMMLALVACGETHETVEEPVVDAPNETPVVEEPLEVGESFDGSRTFEIYEIVKGNKFVMDADMFGAKMTMYRSGDDLYVDMNMMNVVRARILIADGVIYVFSREDNTYVSKEVGQEQLSQIEQMFDFFSEFLTQIEGATLIGTGLEEFLDEDWFYEEIETVDGRTVRYYFDNALLIGVKAEGMEIPFFVSGVLPEGAFDIPEDYEEDEIGDFDAIFNAIFN
jgi:hypothetical protein